MSEGIYRGLVWTNDGVPRHGVIRDGKASLLELSAGVPVPVSSRRQCTGYYEFRHDLAGVHVPCLRGSEVVSGHQCRDCQYREGFVALHRARTIGDVPRQLRDYVAQEHVLYLAAFGANAVKIGTAAISRHPARWYEQGAIAALVLEAVADGIEVRRLEASLSRTYGLAQALRGAAKATLLAELPTLADLDDSLRRVAEEMTVAGDVVQAGSVWQGSLRAFIDRTAVRRRLRIVPTGSAEWTLVGPINAVGQCLMWDSPSGAFLMDVKPLCGRLVTFTDTGTGAMPEQVALF